MISVILPVFRGRRFIGRALAGVRDQSDSAWEIIVVEDGQGDGTESIVKEFAGTVPQPVRYQNLGFRLGTSTARNTALQHAQGELVAFLDADDVWSPTHLATLVKCLAEGHALAVSAVEIWNSAIGRTIATHGMRHEWLSLPRDALFVESIIHTASCVAMPQTTLDRVGHFDTSMPLGQDRDLWFRATGGGGSLGYTGACTTRYVQHTANSSSDRRALLSSVIAFYEKHKNAEGVSALARRHATARMLGVRAALTAEGDSPCK